MPKLCNHENCRKRASYALTYGNPDRCKEHKENRKPQYAVCKCGKARPSYNEPGETKAICCKACKRDTMVNVKHKKCECGKAQPQYNEPGETKAICCKDCKTDTMINVIHKKCECGKAQPIYNEPGEIKAICCKDCKRDTMVDVINKRCECGKAQPTYNEPGETTAICCKDCKRDTMVDVRNQKCKCGKAQPHYNEPGEIKAIYCKKCKTDTMVNVKHKKCKCGKAIPIYNEPGEIKAICCKDCKTATMVNVKDKKCKANNETLCDTYGNRKYKGYCARCFQHMFPNDPLTFQIRSKTKEIAVRDFINSNFDGWVHDKPLHTGHCDCTIRRRIDHRLLIGNTLLVVETDENQHKSYGKMDEEFRYHDLAMAHGGNWIYIRFNPDKYKSKNGKNKNPEIATRLIKLKKEIEKQIKRIKNGENTELLERIYMYYDNYS